MKHRTLDSYLLQALPSGPRKNGEPAVLKQPPNAEEDAEFKICVSRPYRSMGLGSQAANTDALSGDHVW